MVTTGRIGSYDWVELPSNSAELREVVRALGPHLEGLHAVNVSWDSGQMHELAPIPSGWSLQGSHVVSPAITLEMLSNWPNPTATLGATMSGTSSPRPHRVLLRFAPSAIGAACPLPVRKS